MIGCGAGIALAWWLMQRRRTPPQTADLGPVLDVLRAMDDALQEVSVEALNARGEWDRAQFDDVLRRVEALTPAFQDALVDVFSGALGDVPLDPARVTALLAVDRLSAAYTYWTRLFPPRQSNEAMFVLSLLHDLGEKVITALDLCER